MKISPSQPKKSTPAHKRSGTVSFFCAAAIYAPLMTLAMWMPMQENFAAAGDRPMVALTFAQVAGGAPAAPAEAPSEAQAQPEPEPEVKPEPKPEVKPEPKLEPKKVVEKKPRPQPKKEKPKEPVRKPAEKPVEKTPEPAAQAAASSTPAPNAGGAVAKADNGISTLVYGEVQDPFLSEVKRLIEKSLVYPKKARVMRMTGRTSVQFVVAKDGSLSELSIFESSGEKILDKAAAKAVRTASKQWSAPERIVRLRVPVVFAMR